MDSIFPFIQPQVYTADDLPSATELPLYADVAWDFENGLPVFVRGEPVIVTGLNAVLSWAWRALKQERFVNEIYSWNYGNEIMTLIGQQWQQETKEAEAVRYIRECLTALPYITGVGDIKISFEGEGGRLTIACSIQTVYGEATINV